MIEGAAIALVAFLLGRILPPLKRRRDKPLKPICGCGHARAFHEDGGRCRHETKFDQIRCTCRHYDGPIPVETYFAPQLLPPED